CHEDSRHKWVYRGEGSTRPLSTSFDKEWAIARTSTGSMEHTPVEYEALLLREFVRRAHYLDERLPHRSPGANDLEWLALLRHHGAPSRLLDCSYSFYVASYFAF